VNKLNPENVVLVHGDNGAIDWLGASVLKQFPGKKVHAAENFREIIFD
jgi:predicted metal-dependent RNase